MRSGLLLACGSLIGVIAHADVAAQNYPVKPVRIYTALPGASGDFIARLQCASQDEVKGVLVAGLHHTRR